MLRILTAFIACLLLVSPAFAFKMDTHPSRNRLEKTCLNAGGTYSDGPRGYRCDNENCDKKGGTCTVKCTDNGPCEGSTPKVISIPVTLFGILQNGDNVLHERQPLDLKGSASQPGGGTNDGDDVIIP